MAKSHRWAGSVIIAVSEEALRRGDDAEDLLRLPTFFAHRATEVTCFDCGASCEEGLDSPCPAEPRAGYPTAP